MVRGNSGWAVAVAGLSFMLLSAGCTVEMPFLRGQYSRLREETVEESPRLMEWNKIALIDIQGFIGEEAGLFAAGGTSAADVKEKLKIAARDSWVKGVLLRIDSAGGEVTSCDIIYNEVRAFAEETHKPVVAYTMTLATSGGYYVALAGDRIIAHPTTVTGNVGVIMEFINIEKLCNLIGVQTIPVTSGDKKDMGSPLRPISSEEMTIFAGINEAMFQRFLAQVQARRKLTEEATRTVADGRVLIAPQALSLGLVDRLGEMNEALDEVKRLAGIKEAKVVAYRPYPHYNTNIYATFGGEEQMRPKALEDVVRALTGHMGPKFLYLWAPGQ